jgi:hypothetical protein
VSGELHGRSYFLIPPLDGEVAASVQHIAIFLLRGD